MQMSTPRNQSSSHHNLVRETALLATPNLRPTSTSTYDGSHTPLLPAEDYDYNVDSLMSGENVGGVKLQYRINDDDELEEAFDTPDIASLQQQRKKQVSDRLKELRQTLEENLAGLHLQAFDMEAQQRAVVLCSVDTAAIDMESLRLARQRAEDKKREEEQNQFREKFVAKVERSALKRLQDWFTRRQKKEKEMENEMRRKHASYRSIITKTFSHASSQFLEILKKRSKFVKQTYGAMVQETPSLYRRLRDNIAWSFATQQVQLKIDFLRGVKDKLPKGTYILLVSIREGIAGRVVSVHGKKKEATAGNIATTMEVAHDGRFSSTELNFDQRVYIACPSRRRLKPVMVYSFELVQVTGRAAGTCVAWTCFPVQDDQFSMIHGRYKAPMVRGWNDSSIGMYREMHAVLNKSLDNWCGNLYFQINPLPRVFAGVRETDFEIEEINRLSDVSLYQKSTRVLARERAIQQQQQQQQQRDEGDEDHRAPLLSKLSLRSFGLTLLGRNSDSSTATSATLLLDADNEALAEEQHRLALQKERLERKRQEKRARMRLVQDIIEAQRVAYQQHNADAQTNSNNQQGNDSRLPEPSTSQQNLDRNVTFAADRRSQSDVQLRNRKLSTGSILQSQSNEQLSNQNKFSSMTSLRRSTSDIKSIGSTTNLKTLRTESPAISTANSDTDSETDDDSEAMADEDSHCERDYESYQYAVRHSKQWSDRNITLKQWLYVTRSVVTDLGLTSPTHSDFWVSWLCLLLTFWLRLYMHYMSGWFFLSALSTANVRFDISVFYIDIIYLTESFSAWYLAGFTAASVVGNIAVVMVAVFFLWTLNQLRLPFPTIGSKFLVCYSLLVILDPLLVLAVDLIFERYRFGDAFLLANHFHRTEGTHSWGIMMTAAIYLWLGLFATYITYNYLLKIYMNGRIIDQFVRVNGTDEMLPIPYDLEVSIGELRYITRKAINYRCFPPSNGKSYRVVACQYLLTDMFNPTFRETCDHIVIYAICGNQKRVYRHFMRIAGGAFIEIFDDSDTVNLISANLRYVATSTIQLELSNSVAPGTHEALMEALSLRQNADRREGNNRPESTTPLLRTPASSRPSTNQSKPSPRRRLSRSERKQQPQTVIVVPPPPRGQPLAVRIDSPAENEERLALRRSDNLIELDNPETPPHIREQRMKDAIRAGIANELI